MHLTIILLLCLAIKIVHCSSKDAFHEELYLKHLPSGHVYAHFQFTTTWNTSLGDENAFAHFHLFPKSFGEIVQKFSARELHLSLTQGRWKHESWGYPVVDASPGAELWVWFMDSQTNIDSVWMDLINVLSGSFCASLNFMDGKTTVIPKFGFRPRGVTTTTYDRWFSSHVRYASLPREIVCTENLTPWKKLLPCGSKVGLSTLLNAARLYDSSYHSLAVDFRPVCLDAGCDDVGVELSQSVSVVFDPFLLTPSISSTSKWDWSLKKLFGRMITSTCSLATTSSVYVDISSNETRFSLQPSPSRYLETVRNSSGGTTAVRYAVYDVADMISGRRVLNVDVKHDVEPNRAKITPSTLTAHRFQTGYGRSSGGIACLIHNNHPTSDVIIAYQDVIPWYLRVYFHTVKIETFPSVPQRIDAVGSPLKPLHQYYLPGKDRQRSYHLEFVLKLPASSVTRLSFEFERQLLKWTEYPPDANHGFYVGSAVISAVLPNAQNYTSPNQRSATIRSLFEETGSSGEYFVRLHTETLLVSLPTPDFSMPYNVICLTCTVIAIAFGSIHNLTTRRFVVYDEVKHASIVTRLRRRLAAIISRIRRQCTQEQLSTVGDDQQAVDASHSVSNGSQSSPSDVTQ